MLLRKYILGRTVNIFRWMAVHSIKVLSDTLYIGTLRIFAGNFKSALPLF